jgi:predicted RNA-binding Zn-ribbon protein involved in translation (DUF1610 family)
MHLDLADGEAECPQHLCGKRLARTARCRSQSPEFGARTNGTTELRHYGTWAT